MANSKRFQSGREIFEEFIPSYVADDSELEDRPSRVDQLTEAILGDFDTGVPQPAPARPKSSEESVK